MDRDTTLTEDAYDFFGMLRRQAIVIIAFTVLGMGAGVAAVRLPPPLYRATTKVVVGQEGSLFNPRVESGSVADTFTQTMADLIESDIVAREAIDRSGTSVSPKRLLDRLEVTVKPSTTSITVSYESTNRVLAVRTLAAVADAFAERVEDRFGAKVGDESLTVSVFDPAHIEEQVRPKPVRDLAVATIVGLILGLVVAFFRQAPRGYYEAE